MPRFKHPRPYYRTRLRFVVGLFVVSGLVILVRLYSVQVLRHAEFQEQASQQVIRRVMLRPERGRILERRGRLLAMSTSVPSIYAVPRHIDNPGRAAAQLARVLGQSQPRLQRQLASDAPFVWLARQVQPQTAAQVRTLGLRGIQVQREPHRYYPKHHLAGQVLGFVGIDEQGLGGLEYRYDRELAGRPRQVILQRDAVGRQVRLMAGDAAAPLRGANLHLTLDEWLQHLAEREIAAQVRQTRAQSGLVIVMQPHTGDVLAMASYPFFNPNGFRDPAQRAWQRNRAVTDPIEPGSTFKLVIAAASLEEQTVQPGDTFFCEYGLMQRGGRRLHDHKPYGWLSFPEVFEYSSNIGAVKVSERLSSFRLYQYIRHFGFGEKSMVDLPGESVGQLRSPQSWSRFSHASLAIGQEIAVTPLQLITAFAAVANGGVLMRPRLVRRIDAAQETKDFAPEVRRRVVSRQTAKQLTTILIGVVARGTGKLAAVEGYTVAGKTGTAQKVDSGRRGYSRRKVLTSFVGYVPAEAPQLVILIMVDEPQIWRWGGRAAAPVFRRLAQRALPYLQIPASPAQTLRPEPPASAYAHQRREVTGWRVGRTAGRDFERLRLAQARE
ncbi:Stage V sporulation protein D [Candidatus Entotheonellaceae bacterium PAL068K]